MLTVDDINNEDDDQTHIEIEKSYCTIKISIENGGHT